MSAAEIEIEPFFHQGEHSSLFCICLRPSRRPPRGCILYLHPFAEEMHKSRRMAALQARRFASEGYAVLQVDLTGCGDSTGDFGDARWDIWLDDARAAYQLLRERWEAPCLLWGLRLGASLAVALAESLDALERLVLWQPVVNGDLYINQFLRIKLASEMLSTGKAQTGTKELRALLAAGEPIEVGGYKLSPALGSAIEHLQFAQIAPYVDTWWLELSNDASETLSPASMRVVQRWREHGVNVCTQTIAGEPFWSTQEITECPALIDATVQTLHGPCP